MSPAEPTVPPSRIPSFDEAYDEYVPLFLRALGHLSRMGFPLAPDEGMDVIHDFFVEAWPGLSERYQPEKGSFSAYVGVAFARFARKRIVRMDGWRGRLRDLHEIAQDSTTETLDPADRLQSQEVVAALHAAMDRLSPLESAVLRDFLLTGDSERTLAVRHEITRHRLRELLVTSLGQVAGEVLASHGDQAASDWEVSSGLWIDGRSDRDIALRMQKPLPEIRKAHRHSMEQLLRAIRGQVPIAEREAKHMGNQLTKLLKDTTLDAGNQALLEEVRKRHEEIRCALLGGEAQPFSDDEVKRLQQSPQWVAEVYAALGTAAELPINGQTDQEIYDMLNEERNNVYWAFAEAVLSELPAELMNWQERFNGVARANPDVIEILRSEEPEELRGKFDELLQYAITPVVVFEACEGVRLLLDRIQTIASWPQNEWPQSGPLAKVLDEYSNRRRRSPAFVLARTEAQANLADGVYVPWILLVEELQATPDCPSVAAADALARWIVDVARVCPLIVPEYCAEVSGKAGVALQREDGDEHGSLYQRWSRRHPIECEKTHRSPVFRSAGMAH